MTTTVRVLPRFSVCVAGKRYDEGETVEVSDDAATGWHAWGSVTPVEAKKPRRRPAARADDSSGTWLVGCGKLYV